jgi:hypothetical protein
MKNWFLLALSDTTHHHKILLLPGSYKFIASRLVGIDYSGCKRFAIGRMGFAFSAQDSGAYFRTGIDGQHYGPAIRIGSLIATQKVSVIYLC